MKHWLRYRVLKLQAVGLLACARPVAALRRFERMTTIWPADAYAIASCAHLHAELKNLPGAIACLQRLTAIAPAQAVHWFNLGYLLQQAERLPEAEQAFAAALQLDPSLDRAWYGLATVLMARRAWQPALTALEKNVALQPMSPYGWYRMVQVRLAIGDAVGARAVVDHLQQFEPRLAAQLVRELDLGKDFLAPAQLAQVAPLGWSQACR